MDRREGTNKKNKEGGINRKEKATKKLKRKKE